MTSVHSRDDRDARPDDGLAQAARDAHAASLDHLSPRVRAQLAQRRRAALSAHARPSTARRWPMLALGSAAALTLAIGLFVLRGSDDTVTPPGDVAQARTGTAPERRPAMPANAAGSVIATAPAVAGTGAQRAAVERIRIDDEVPAELLAAEFSGADAAMGFDTLEENPDFYLWLGSNTVPPANASEVL